MTSSEETTTASYSPTFIKEQAQKAKESQEDAEKRGKELGSLWESQGRTTIPQDIGKRFRIPGTPIGTDIDKKPS